LRSQFIYQIQFGWLLVVGFISSLKKLSHVSKFQNGSVGSWLGSSSMTCRVNIFLSKIVYLASCELIFFIIHIKEKLYIVSVGVTMDVDLPSQHLSYLVYRGCWPSEA